MILPANWRDLLDAYALEKACFGRDAWGLMDLGMALVAPNLRLKAVVAGRLAGLIVAEPHEREGYAVIATLGVHPDFQRRGIGARLLTEVEGRLDVPVLRLTVRQSNLPAIALYRKFGYAQVSVWEGYYAGGEVGIVMEKSRARGSPRDSS